MNIAIHLEHHLLSASLLRFEEHFERLYPHLFLLVFRVWSIVICIRSAHKFMYKLHLCQFAIQMRAPLRMWSFTFLALFHFNSQTDTHTSVCIDVLVNLVLSALLRLNASRTENYACIDTVSSRSCSYEWAYELIFLFLPLHPRNGICVNEFSECFKDTQTASAGWIQQRQQ